MVCRYYPHCQPPELSKPARGCAGGARHLSQALEAPGHRFWPEDVSILQILEPTAIITHAQITDVYLLGLAVQKSGKLATLDRRIPAAAVRGGRQALEIIAP